MKSFDRGKAVGRKGRCIERLKLLMKQKTIDNATRAQYQEEKAQAENDFKDLVAVRNKHTKKSLIYKKRNQRQPRS